MKPSKMLILPIKALIVSLLAFGSAFAATEYKWIGGASGDWSNPENWDQNGSPKGSGIVVFDSEGDVTVNFDVTDKPLIGGLKFLKGNAKIVSATAPTLYLASSSFKIEVAENAQGMLSNVTFSTYNKNTTCTKTGLGTFTSYGTSFDTGGNVTHLKINEGVFRKLGGGSFNPRSIELSSGTELVFGGSVQTTVAPTWTIPAGAKVTMLAGASANANGGLMGEGNIEIKEGGSAAILYAGPSVDGSPFTGKVTGGDLTIELTSGCSTPDGGPFIVQFSDQFERCSFRRPQGLGFAAGIGTFRLRGVEGYYGTTCAEVCLDDVEGKPITLYSGVYHADGVSFSGTGNFMLGTTMTITKAKYASTGFIGVFGNGSLTLGSDFNLTKNGSLTGVFCEGGSLTINGSGRVEIPVHGFLTGSCTFSTSVEKTCDFDLTVPQLNLNGGAGKQHNLGGGEIVVDKIKNDGGVDTYNIISGGRYFATPIANTYDDVTSLKAPGFLQFSADAGVASLQIDGGEFWHGSGYGLKHVRVNGGRFHVKSVFGVNPDNGAAKFVFNGGDAVLEVSGSTFEFQQESTAYSHNVGSNGMSICAGRRASTKDTSVLFHNQIKADPDLGDVIDGGVTLHSGLTYRFDKPLAIQGPFSVLDGVLRVYPTQVGEGVAGFGTGDFVMRNTLVELTFDRTPEETLHLATGADSTLVYNGGSTFNFRYDANRKFQHITASNLRRGGRGAVLTLSELDGHQDKIGTEGGDSFTVTGMSATNYVPAVIIGDSTGNDPHFAKYTVERGFAMIPDSEYKTSLADCTENDIVYGALTASADAHIGAAKVPSWGWLSVNSGKTLTIGNGTDPAMIIFEVGGGVNGNGTIDFGTSEGVFYPSYAREQKSYAHEVKCVLDGKNGVSYVGADYNNVRRMAISSANVYEGPTMIEGCIVYPRNAKAFSEGDVTVGPGQYRGGRVEFDEDVVFANDFHVGGWGWERTGAFVFDSNSEISGSVEILDDTRVRVTDGHSAKISGTVTGDKLVVWGNAAGTTGVLALTGSNVHTGGTEVVKAVLQVADSAALGAGEVLLDGGTLKIANTEACTISNAVKGLGSVALAGKGAVSFAKLQSEDGVGFTLNLTKHRQTIDTLVGFKEITTSRSDKIVLSILNDESFSGTVPANVELYFGGEAPKPGFVIILR